MFFVQMTIPPNTPISNPLSHGVNIASGVIRRVVILHPKGCVDLVGIWLEYRSAKIYPMNDDGYFLGNGQQIIFTPDTLIAEPPYVITIKAYNLDDTYQHKPTITIEMEFLGSYKNKENQVMQFLNSPIMPARQI